MENKKEQFFFQIYQNQELTFQFDEGLSVFFGINGNSHIFCGNHHYELSMAGILVVNPLEVYRLLCPADASLLCLRVSRSVLALANWDYGNGCSCYAHSNMEETLEYRKIRELIAVIFQDYFENQDSSMITTTGMQLIDYLKRHFAVEGGNQTQRESTMERLKHILDTIHEHWNEDISLSEIASQEYLSVGYLSRFFHKYLNMNFSQYVKELRLNHSVHMLKENRTSITHISYECGFKTPSAFIEAFKQQYGQTPKQFRQGLKDQKNTENIHRDLQSDMTTLLAYLPEDSAEEIPSQTKQIIVNCAKLQSVDMNAWRRILNIGYAKDGLLANIQEQIRQAQKEIGFEFIRFHGLLDDDMHIYTEDKHGMPQFYFAYVDILFDFILSTGLKPYVELGFMPSLLARSQTRIFDRPSIISGCIDTEKWSLLIRGVIHHLIQRYGKEEVRRWQFTTISQNYVHLNCIRWDDYQDIYETAYRAVKEIDSGLEFGGPGVFPEYIDRGEGMRAFLDFVQERDCTPDFIAFQFYPHIYTNDPLFIDFTISQQSAPAILSEDPDYLTHSLDKMVSLLKEYNISNREIYLEESTSTLWQRDLSSDTCYKAVWLAKNMCDSYGRAVFGYWLLTDLMEERGALEDVFHGGYGLFTYNGIPKAGYHAMRLLSRMGNRLVDFGEGWMLTRKGDDYQLVAYNYCHYSNIYRYRYKRLTRAQDAYSVFEQGKVIRMQFRLGEIPDGKYRVERWEINRENGSAFDKWMEMGSPRYPDDHERCYLMQTAQPSYRVEVLRVHGEVHVEVLLHPMEMQMIHFCAINIAESKDE